jgi:hypothetical protein
MDNCQYDEYIYNKPNNQFGSTNQTHDRRYEIRMTP